MDLPSVLEKFSYVFEGHERLPRNIRNDASPTGFCAIVTTHTIGWLAEICCLKRKLVPERAVND